MSNKKNNEVLYSKKIDTQFPFMLDIFPQVMMSNNKSVIISHKIACDVRMDFTGALGVDDIDRLDRFIANKYPDLHEDLTIRISTDDCNKCYLWLSVSEFNMKYDSDLDLSLMAFKIIMSKKDALLKLKFPTIKVVIDSSGNEILMTTMDNNISSLAKFVLFVLYNQFNWGFMYEEGA
jgi:hypothetical protein